MADILKSRLVASGEIVVTQEYAIKHAGIDVVSWKGYNALDTILAHSDGEVIRAVADRKNDHDTKDDDTYGNMVIIRHRNGMYTLYGHMNEVRVEAGDNVRKGDPIGTMGNTGNSYGGHLHFEVRDKDNNIIDPTPYLNADLPEVEADVKPDGGENTETSYVIYTVKRGDTLWKIARAHGTSVEILAEINDIDNVNFIRTGLQLKIPMNDMAGEESPRTFAVGDIIRLREDATYYNGKPIPAWVFEETLYYRGVNKNGIVFSTLKTGEVTGTVKPEMIY